MHSTDECWYIDANSNAQAEGMLHIALGLAANQTIFIDGTRRYVWRCTKEYVDKFEKTCGLFKIPYIIYTRADDGALRVWRTTPLDQPDSTTTSSAGVSVPSSALLPALWPDPGLLATR